MYPKAVRMNNGTERREREREVVMMFEFGLRFEMRSVLFCLRVLGSSVELESSVIISGWSGIHVHFRPWESWQNENSQMIERARIKLPKAPFYTNKNRSNMSWYGKYMGGL